MKRGQLSFLSQTLDKKVEFFFECYVKDWLHSKVSFNFECESFVEYQILDKM